MFMLKGSSKEKPKTRIMSPDGFCQMVRKNPSQYSASTRAACAGVGKKPKDKLVKKKKKNQTKKDNVDNKGAVPKNSYGK